MRCGGSCNAAAAGAECERSTFQCTGRVRCLATSPVPTPCGARFPLLEDRTIRPH
jgi:hypothetical protein